MASQLVFYLSPLNYTSRNLNWFTAPFAEDSKKREKKEIDWRGFSYRFFSGKGNSQPFFFVLPFEYFSHQGSHCLSKTIFTIFSKENGSKEIDFLFLMAPLRKKGESRAEKKSIWDTYRSFPIFLLVFFFTRVLFFPNFFCFLLQTLDGLHWSNKEPLQSSP